VSQKENKLLNTENKRIIGVLTGSEMNAPLTPCRFHLKSMKYLPKTSIFFMETINTTIRYLIEIKRKGSDIQSKIYNKNGVKIEFE
jgi:hypothetical protein